VFCFFERGDGRFTGDGGKSFQKVFECFSALQVVEERLDRDAGSAKHRSSAKNIGIFDDDTHSRDCITRDCRGCARKWQPARSESDGVGTGVSIE